VTLIETLRLPREAGDAVSRHTDEAS